MEDDKFNQIYDEHARGLLGYLIKLTGSTEVGQDLLQELFIDIYEKYDHLQIQHEKPYFFSMAYRLFVKWLGKEKKKQDSTTEFIEETVEVKGFESKVHWKILRENILKELRRVEPILEHIFILRVDNNFKIKEISDVVNKSERSINRYVTKIASIIEQQFGSSIDEYIDSE